MRDDVDIPGKVRRDVERTLEGRSGRAVMVAATKRVGGGCISDARVLETDGGERFFLKIDPNAPTGFFAAEADGLKALGGVSGVRTPEVVGWGSEPREGWLLLEYVPPGDTTSKFWRALGEMVAALHSPVAGDPGYEADNYIGSLPQGNASVADWGCFWRDRRIGPQLELAFRHDRLEPDDRVWTELMDRLPELLDPTTPQRDISLLHGDLWSGNVYADSQGDPVLIDPAVYRGDGQVDIAMSELFGGFGPEFYEAYELLRPLDSEYGRVRRSVYQLYPLLVHVNLFGAGYVRSARRVAERALRS